MRKRKLDGKTYWVIDDETTYGLFPDGDFDASSICDMCVDGEEKQNCPTQEALGIRKNPCEVVILDEERYAQYITKRMTGKWWEE